MSGAITFRRAVPADDDKAFIVFRRSIWDYLRRSGFLGPDDPAEPPVEEAWRRWQTMYRHLRETAAEHWVAESGDGDILGYARSIERDGVLELTEFFVDPETQARGVGRGLLERAFPPGRGRHRSIVATQDPRAVGLYLRFGVSVQSSGVSFSGRPEPVSLETDLETVAATEDDATVEAILSVEEYVLGHRREVDVRYFLRDRPGVLYLRRDEVVGFGFDPGTGGSFGPIAMLDPADVPAALARLETAAHASGLSHFGVLLPLANRTGVNWLLGRGFHIDPFWVLYLADEPFVQYDRIVTTAPPAIL